MTYTYRLHHYATVKAITTIISERELTAEELYDMYCDWESLPESSIEIPNDPEYPEVYRFEDLLSCDGDLVISF